MPTSVFGENCQVWEDAPIPGTAIILEMLLTSQVRCWVIKPLTQWQRAPFYMALLIAEASCIGFKHQMLLFTPQPPMQVFVNLVVVVEANMRVEDVHQDYR